MNTALEATASTNQRLRKRGVRAGRACAPGDRTLEQRGFGFAGLLVILLVTGGCLAPRSTPTASTAGPELSSTADASPQATNASPANPSATAYDACGLLSPAEVSAIVGGPLPTAKPAPAGGWVAGQCAWSSPKGAFLVSVGTPDSIKAAGGSGTSTAKDKLSEFAQRTAGGVAPTRVKGIGDDAIVSDSGMASYKNDIYLEVVNLRLTKKQLIEIVKLATDRL